eukprot:TRINITY_DN25621_c0_g1_i1.p2 TRINITY_DN25621_c0_g1~~TRINITY_DN25621_c0_g1_i1.p2  ORF type:complete len:150 (+),score=11.37 TRINITY_DN25621_c0_g1_i1:33-452(+)
MGRPAQLEVPGREDEGVISSFAKALTALFGLAWLAPQIGWCMFCSVLCSVFKVELAQELPWWMEPLEHEVRPSLVRFQEDPEICCITPPASQSRARRSYPLRASPKQYQLPNFESRCNSKTTALLMLAWHCNNNQKPYA